jgi:hypothetical protein
MFVIDALRDKRLFGGLPAFKDLSTWARWIIFLRALDGLPLDAAQERIFCQHTGRSRYAPPPDGWKEAAVITGRQSGKTRIAATIAAVAALDTPREPDGTALYSLLISQDQRAALRTVFSYAVSPFGGLVPTLKRLLNRKRTDTLTLESGVVLAAYPCRPDAVRGLRAVCVVLDEVAFFRNSENYPTDREMLRAARPCLATTGGKLVILSSPYGQAGALWELHRAHFGRDESPVLVWQASAPEMNPTLPQGYLDRMAQDDPEAYRSEVLGEFRSGIATFFDVDALDACVDAHVRERPAVPDVQYIGSFDASGGRNDPAALALAHAVVSPTSGSASVLDVVRAWTPPFNPAHIIAEACDILKHYRCTEVRGDKYAAEFVVAAFRDHGITYHAAEQNRSALYLELLPLVNAGRVRLLDDGELLRELRGLERRRGATKDRVDHRPGAHDDRAIAAALALVQATSANVHDPALTAYALELTASAAGDRLGLGEFGFGGDLGMPR